jgi:hypothetical protein
MPKTDVRVKLVGEDGNAFAIMGRVSKALKRAGHADLAEKYLQEAQSGDYNHLLVTTLEYVEEEEVDDCEDDYDFNYDEDDED